MNSSQPTPKIHHFSFDQNCTKFSVALDNNGFSIFTTHPCKRTQHIDLTSHCDNAASVSQVAMFCQCNQFCLVEADPNATDATQNVRVWNSYVSKCLGQIPITCPVKNVKFTGNHIIIVCLHKVSVYQTDRFNRIHQIITALNEKGLCEVTESPWMIACPGLNIGEIRVKNLGSNLKDKIIKAHDSDIACMSLNGDGRILATASVKGTLIRVFSTLNGSLLQEVRRGTSRAEVYSLAFSVNAQLLAVCSDKGTAHVFSLKVDSALFASNRIDVNSDPNHSNGSRTSSLSMFRGVLPGYFSSEWSIAQFQLPKGIKHFVGFGHQEENTVIVIGMDGSFYRCRFDPVAGGMMRQLERLNFLNLEKTHT